MIRVVSFNFNGSILPLFIDDTETGYNGKDVMSKPGVYEELTSDKFSLPLAELQGSIDGYTTKCMGLLAVVEPDAENDYPMQDYTNQVKQLLTIPETGAKVILGNMDEDMRTFLSTALEVIHFYEKVTSETKVFLPEEAFGYISEDVAKKMRSTRHVYVLKNSDNQEIVQADCTATFGVVLPSVDDLHSDIDVSPKALDILRVIAPCRKPVGDGGAFQYNGIYHTPYYRIDPKIRGAVPSYLNFLNGFPKNDTLEIQQNERHMRDNLRTFVQADVASYVSEIVTGMFLATHVGQSIKRLISCKDSELAKKLAIEINDMSAGSPVKCDIHYTDLQELLSGHYTPNDLAALVGQSLVYDSEGLQTFVSECTGTMHVVDIENLPFVFQLTDEDKEKLTTLLIQGNVITRVMLEYLLNLCLKAYEVNWGHSGATRAIPRFVTPGGINAMNNVMGAYLSQTIGHIQAPADVDFTLLYSTQIRSSDDEDDEGDEDEIFTDFDYYITNDTAMKMRAGTANDFFGSGSTGAETSESAIVEYWRKVDGESHLSYFVSSAFTTTGDYNVLFEAFIKLMRWGSVKPSLLVFQDHPVIRTVFDLNTGKEIPNTAIVDESQLVLSNGCRYSLERLLSAEDVLGAKPAIAGFLLSKNYGVKKYFLASWVDIGEMVSRNEIDVDSLKTVTDIPLNDEMVLAISQFENSGYQLFTSNHNIEQGLKFNIQPAQLSELALLIVPGVLRTAEYLRSKQNTMVVTTKDRQYQILATYCEAIRKLYATEGDALSGESVSTAELSAMAVKVYQWFVAGSENQAPDVNQVRANQAVMTMQLDNDNAKYVDVPLEGKFTIISDMDMQSDLPSIEFSDPTMQQVARKVRDRVVLLMLETPEYFVLCRKDISAPELLVVDHKIEHRKYSAFASVIKALKAGQTVNISNSKTGSKHPAVLHTSLSSYL